MNDIAAQRAMLERGEEKRKADWKQAERERLRDTFAAAALTGLISHSIAPSKSVAAYSQLAGEYADAMIREREQHHIPDAGKMVENTTNHDAVPEARAYADGEPAPKRGGEAGLNPRDGTGNTPSEAEIDALEFVVEEGRTASIDDYGILRSWLIRLRPEWESQSYDGSDEKRTNTTISRDATPGEDSVPGEGTLTDEERAAIERTIDAANGMAPAEPWTITRLRNLLERLR